MKRIIPFILIIFLIFGFSFPVFATESETEIEIVEVESDFEELNEPTVSENIIEYTDTDTEIEIENNELLYNILASLQIIMYIVFLQFLILWSYLIFIFVKKIFKFLGIGLI